MVPRPTACLRLASAPWMRVYPQDGFSMAIITMSLPSSAIIGGRPGERRSLESHSSDQVSAPTQQRMGCNYGSDILKGFASHPFGFRGQPPALIIRKSQASVFFFFLLCLFFFLLFF